MVNRVDGNNYYDYQKLKNVNIPDSGEKFNLEYNRNELPSEADGDKNKASKSSDAKKRTEDDAGVRLELSGQGQKAASEKSRTNEMAKSQSEIDAKSIIATVRDFITDAIAAVKAFFYNLWYDPQPEADAQTETDTHTETDAQIKADARPETELTEQERAVSFEGHNDELSAAPEMDEGTAYRINSERIDREIQKHLRSGDLNQVMSLLTDDGKKTIARNSSLLTYYDRNGRMVEPSASDRERILHGDMNTRKL